MGAGVGGPVTDLLDQLEGEVTSNDVLCARPGCTTALPRVGEVGYHSMRRYCDAHQPRSSPSAAKRRAKAKVEGRSDETPPASVITNNFTVKVPTPPKTPKTSPTAVVEEGATEMLSLLPMILAAFGDEVCPVALQSAIPSIAHQIAILSGYHPWIRKLFTSGENSGEIMAWFALILVTSPVIITILAHHNLVSGKLAERLAYVSAMGGAFSAAATESVSADPAA
jgi:hypothetical protein